MRAHTITIFALLSCLTILTVQAQLYVIHVILSTATIKHDTLTGLHTEGSYIKNEADEIVQLTGFCWFDYLNPYHSRDEPVGTEPFGKLEYRLNEHKNLGVNTIRLSISKGRWDDSLHNHPEYSIWYVDQLDYIVETCNELGIYVYLCFHYGSGSMNDLQANLMDEPNWHPGNYTKNGKNFTAPRLDVSGWTNNDPAFLPDQKIPVYDWEMWQSRWLDWTVEVAARYKDHTNVIGYQIWAEPAWANYTSDEFDRLEASWADFILGNVDSIRSVDSDALIFVPSAGHYSRKWVSAYWRENPIPRPNIVYTWTIYYKHHTGDAWVKFYETGDFESGKTGLTNWHKQHGLWMVEEGIAPVMLGESGFFSYLDHFNNEEVLARDWLRIINEYKQGWTYWLWYMGSSEGTGIWKDYDPYTLAPAGEVVDQNLIPLP